MKLIDRLMLPVLIFWMGFFVGPAWAQMNGALIYNGTVTPGKLSATNSPSSGQVAEYNGTNFTWATIGISGISAGGDLTGTYPNPTIADIQGVPVSLSSTGGDSGYGLYYNGSDILFGQQSALDTVVGAVSTTNQALSGNPTIDGIGLGDYDHVLLTGQTTPSQNGPWQTLGTGWVRPVGYATGRIFPRNVYTVWVTSGTIYGGTWWICNAGGGITVDTTSTTWTQFSAGGGTYTGTAPIVVTGTVISASAATSSTPGVVQPDNSTITVSSGVVSAVVPYGNFIVEETPSGSVNGSNTTFTLANAPHSGSLMVFVNGVLQKPTSQYTLSSATITFVSAPKSGFWLTASYQK